MGLHSPSNLLETVTGNLLDTTISLFGSFDIFNDDSS